MKASALVSVFTVGCIFLAGSPFVQAVDTASGTPALVDVGSVSATANNRNNYASATPNPQDAWAQSNLIGSTTTVTVTADYFVQAIIGEACKQGNPWCVAVALAWLEVPGHGSSPTEMVSCGTSTNCPPDVIYGVGYKESEAGTLSRDVTVSHGPLGTSFTVKLCARAYVYLGNGNYQLDTGVQCKSSEVTVSPHPI